MHRRRNRFHLLTLQKLHFVYEKYDTGLVILGCCSEFYEQLREIAFKVSG